MNTELMELAERAVSLAEKGGASSSAVAVHRRRFIELRQRDGALERLRESTSSSLSVDLYVDGRYSSHTTCDLRPEAVAQFITQAIPLTRLLGADAHRKLPDPALYEGRPKVDLQQWDPGYEQLDTDRRRQIVDAVERAARDVEGPIISVEGSYSDGVGEWVQVHSNGFADGDRSTEYWTGATVTVEDAGARKPEDYHWVGARFLSDLEASEAVGVEASRRALDRIGQVTLESGTMPVVLENRAAGRFVGSFLGAMSGAALHQRRSFLLDREGEVVGSPSFSIRDEPLLPRAFASRRFDEDGISARPRDLVKDGTLCEYLIDVYYGSKLGVEPTGGSISNLVVVPGTRDLDALLAEIDRGVFVTGILGGNSDPTSGDFSHGVKGFEIVDGALGRPIGEMNITGSHTELWQQLVEVGNDPYPYSSMLTPSLRFDGLSVSGIDAA